MSGITSDKSWINNLILVEKEEEYYIGELARTQCEIKHFITEQGNLKNINNILLLIKAVLPLISEKKDEDIILGIGVPISTSIERMKILSSKLKGEIKIKIKNDATKDIIEITKVIKKVFIMPESYGTYYKVGSSFKEKTAIDAIVISLDLITEIMTIYNGNLMRNSSRNLIDASCFALLNKIATSLQQQTNNIVHPTSILQNIRENQNNIVIAGKTYDISQVKNHFIRLISAEILDNLMDVINNLPLDAKIDYYIITGEWMSLFWTEIEIAILEKNLIGDFNFDRIIKVKEPAFANAIGFELMIKEKLKKLETNE